MTLSNNKILKSKIMALTVTGKENVDLIITKRDNAPSNTINALLDRVNQCRILLVE